jgi:hypothetical protein
MRLTMNLLFISALFAQVPLFLSLQQAMTATPLLTAYSPLINASAQLLLAANPSLSSCWICTRSTEKDWNAHPVTLVDWTNVKRTLYQSSTHLPFTEQWCWICLSGVIWFKTPSNTPIRKFIMFHPYKSTGSIAQTDLYETAPLCIQRLHFPDARPIGSLNISQCA